MSEPLYETFGPERMLGCTGFPENPQRGDAVGFRVIEARWIFYQMKTEHGFWAKQPIHSTAHKGDGRNGTNPEISKTPDENLSRYSWAQEIVNGWAQGVAFAMQQNRAFFDTMIPELTPGTHYGQNCPNCVGKQSLNGRRTL